MSCKDSTADSSLRQVLEVQPILGSSLGLLHRPQPSERANPHRDAQQLAPDRVLRELGVAGYPPRTLNDVETAEDSHRGYVSAAADDFEVAVRVKGSVAGSRQSGLQALQGMGKAFQVIGIRAGNYVQILGATDEAVGADRDSADHDELDVMVMERLEQGAEIELGQWALAAPLIALSCLQSACTRASLSLIGTRRSASRRSTRARFRSSMSPLNALSAMRSSLIALVSLFALFLASWALAQGKPTFMAGRRSAHPASRRGGSRERWR